MGPQIQPFLLEVPEAVLSDLRRRLLQTRWPEPETVSDWSQGVPLAYLRDLCGYWADGYDWRPAEARLNALPLILTHGWPGSVVEFLKVIGPLTDPDDGGDAFHVVCPSLPGYGFSGKPGQAGWGVERIARAWAELMARLAGPDPAALEDLTDAERAALESLEYAAEWGLGLLARARYPAPDGRVRADRLARLPGRLDRGEVLVLDGP